MGTKGGLPLTMNLLAHFYLSGLDDSLTVGNFLGDFVKGKQYLQYPEAIARGILLHRSIDDFTDHHPVHLRSKRRLGNRYGHYAGVAIDIFYDHLLAKHWDEYADRPLPDFSQCIYQILKLRADGFPMRARQALEYMSAQDWLLQYRELEGIRRAMSGLSRRTKFESNLEQAPLDLTKHFSLFQQDFEVFFPELILHTQNFLST